MSDPTTELATEFLEFNNYVVKKETKFYKNKRHHQTPGDIDIIAISPRGAKFSEFRLKNEIVAEAKNWQVLDRDTLDWIYQNKFKYIDNHNISWKQLNKYIKSRRFERVLFCRATSEKIYDYAYKKYKIRIITTGFIIKYFCQRYTYERMTTYYPEAYHFSLIRNIIYYLQECYKFKDQLTLKDLVSIDLENEPRYRNNFNKMNASFMKDLLYYDNDTLEKLLQEDTDWYLDKAIEILAKKNKKLLSKLLRRKIRKLNISI